MSDRKKLKALAEKVAALAVPMDLKSPYAKSLDGSTDWWKRMKAGTRSAYARGFEVGYLMAGKDLEPRKKRPAAENKIRGAAPSNKAR